MMRLASAAPIAAEDSTADEQIIDPSTGEVFGTYAAASPEFVDATVETAARASAAWAAQTPDHRRRVLIDVATVIRHNAQELAELESRDTGMPIAVALQDAEKAANTFEYFAGLAYEVNGKTYPTATGELNYSLPQPFGVVARVIAYNHPLWFTAMGAGALVCGNALVVKPSEQTPVTPLRLAELCRDVLPPGLLNVVLGGPDVATRLVSHPKVRRVAIVGGFTAGSAILRAANTGKLATVTAELGGKNAFVVFPDVDVTAAVEAAIKGMNFASMAGQSCSSTSRVLVHESIAKRFVDELSERLATIHVGPATEPGIGMGPVISERHRDKIFADIDRARQEGARVTIGGGRPASTPAGGWYVEPTCIADVAPSMAIATDEVFGPVVAVLTWSDEEELIHRINAVSYGLTANVWSRDVARAQRVVAQLEVGYAWINASNGGRYWGIPYGGVKDSGIGRESSIEELQSYVQLKNVRVNLGS